PQQRNQTSTQNSTREPSPEQKPSPGQRSSSRPSFNPLSLLSQLLGFGIRWLVYAALAIGLVVTAWIYRDELQEAWQKLMDELRELWDWWFGRKHTSEEAAASAEVVAPPRTFASFH